MNHTKAYIGSTTTGLCVREGNRKRKYREDTHKVEPAIRWWRKYANFWQFCPITIKTCPSAVMASEFEIATTKVRKPELNSPFENKFLPHHEHVTT